jgi:phosphatidylglycerophosphate synthase
VKTTLQIIAISLLIFYNQLGSFERLAPLSLWLAMLASLYSGAEYFIRFGPELFGRRSKAEEESV